MSNGNSKQTVLATRLRWLKQRLRVYKVIRISNWLLHYYMYVLLTDLQSSVHTQCTRIWIYNVMYHNKKYKELTTVRACPSFSWGPRRVMVLTSESEEGTSTHTPVVWSTSWRPCPFGPTMYLCWVFRTSTETVEQVRHCKVLGEQYLGTFT